VDDLQPDPNTLDPGGDDPPIRLNRHVISMVQTATYSVSLMDADDDARNAELLYSRTELDSHANMCVVGRHCFVIRDTGRSIEVNPFTPDYQPMRVKLVDAAIRYDCPYTGKSHLLIIQDALHVPAMVNNLIPPFAMREAGVHVGDVPKIHVDNPGLDDHCLYFASAGVRIPLSLWGTFSFFPSHQPTVEEMNSIDSVLTVTPDNWNPHDIGYAQREEVMLDADGNMAEPSSRQKILMEDLPDSDDVARISALETHIVDELHSPDTPYADPNPIPSEEMIPAHDDQFSEISSVYHSSSRLYHNMRERARDSKFMGSIGSTHVSGGAHLVSEADDSDDDEDDADADEMDMNFLDEIREQLNEQDLEIDINDKELEHELDQFFVSATTGKLKHDINYRSTFVQSVAN